MDVDLFFDHCFNFLNVKTEKTNKQTNKNRLKLTNLEGLEFLEK